MKKLLTFKKRTRINAPVEEVFKWHERPGAIQRLNPPWDPIPVIRQTGGIQKGAEVVMKINAGLISISWTARHIEYEKNRLFVDTQIKGPFSKWTHTHCFEPDSTNACILEDIIEYAFPFHQLSSGIMDVYIRNKLARAFAYRHLTTLSDIARHQEKQIDKPLKILISGASGLIGSNLVPFLTTGGHDVLRLVRKPPKNMNEIYWEPASGSVNLDGIDQIDAVIHLAGENIGKGRWTDEKKRKIIDSRVKGTATIADAISKLKKPPKVFLSASAIGYYGNRGDAILTESDEPGTDFISDVCQKWEAAASPAIEKGVRTVFLRIGIVLTPAGGALARLLLPFQLGIGGKISTGKQYMSWISIDDVLYAIYHVLFNQRVNGPVNIVSPNSATNSEFTHTLAKTISRPAFFTVPEKAIELAFGEMGHETILSSTRVKPALLEQSGCQFTYPSLESALRHVLGR